METHYLHLSALATMALVAIAAFSTLTVVGAGVPMSRFNPFMRQDTMTELGLYDMKDKVVILNNVNFNDTVLHQNRSTLVEFYNSFCGHCKRFAPTYKELAEQVYPWREVLPVAALDCAAEENNDICREYEIMSYPTLRYFGPNYVINPTNLGRQIDTQDPKEIREQLAQFLTAENNTAHTSIPNLKPVETTKEDLFKQGGKYVVLVYEPENSTVGVQTILHFQRWPDVHVRRINRAEIASQYELDGQRYHFVTINRNGEKVPYGVRGNTPQDHAESVASVLRSLNLAEKPDTPRENDGGIRMQYGNDEHTVDDKKMKEIIDEVQRNHHLVYQADLELAIRKLIFNEMSKLADITGERLLSMQRLLGVIQRYNPLGPRGREFINRLHQFVMQHNEALKGKDFEEEVQRLEKELGPIFTATHYVGCMGSNPKLRGYTCTLWQLFHHMTVQAARLDISQDPLEVLQALHGYAKHYFGCTDCSQHFQAMAARRKIWNVPNKDEAILWLWEAHNEVNQRLAGDLTEDPKFPKIQFPSPQSCPLCYKNPSASPASLENNWNKDAVLSFMKNIHNPEYVSRFGTSDIDPLERMRQKRMIGNVFSDMDMRMGMLLYGFCIVMMVVAFKLFACKGYRKKPYGHDMLGKV